MFDLTMTYRADSDFFAPYGNYEEIPFTNTAQEDFSFGKTKLVSWMVSNCGAGLRNSFVRELQKYIPVDVYGSCSGQFGQSRSCDRGETCKDIIKQYKFYLSFENALCEDYITEKYWGHLGKRVVTSVIIRTIVRPVFYVWRHTNRALVYTGSKAGFLNLVCVLFFFFFCCFGLLVFFFWGGGGAGWGILFAKILTSKTDYKLVESRLR